MDISNIINTSKYILLCHTGNFLAMKYNKQIVKIKATITREPMEATTSPFKTSDDLENTFLRDNSRKKSYAKVLQEDNLQDFPLEAGNGEMEDQPYQDSDTEERSGDIAG